MMGRGVKCNITEMHTFLVVSVFVIRSFGGVYKADLLVGDDPFQ